MSGTNDIKQFEILIKLIKSIFPNDTLFDTQFNPSRMSYICVINWEISNKVLKTSKRSKIIHLIITYEWFVSYQKLTPAIQEIVNERFVIEIGELFDKFNPDHTVPKYETPPIEEWLIKECLD